MFSSTSELPRREKSLVPANAAPASTATTTTSATTLVGRKRDGGLLADRRTNDGGSEDLEGAGAAGASAGLWRSGAGQISAAGGGTGAAGASGTGACWGDSGPNSREAG